jgi:(2R)-sulfolactate sulfo-lyase subunit alpha
MAYGFLIHGSNDHVGVAVRDLRAGETVTGVYQKGGGEVTVTVLSDIPLGHKVALVNLNPGDRVLKYNEVIGVATQPIRVGDHVHVHNLKSVRWA